ncbi:MAG: RNA methyltransferase [Desulfobacteraceae bacterium]|nr:RNA methyltransferase [Desulfobacteraceae bacterium]
MDTFGFTKKKLISLPIESRHKHLIKWLSEFYQKLTTNRVNLTLFDLFTDHYNQILSWTQMAPFIKPEANNLKIWIEVISDRIHYHRSFTNITIRDHDLLEKIQTNDLANASNKIDFHCHIALDGLRSLFNVGSIFRTCDATGFNSILLGNIPGKEHPGIQKTSMGAHEWIKEEHTKDLAQTLIQKKEEGYRVIGVETIEGSVPYYKMRWEPKTIVVFGNEEYGISSHVLKTCDTFVHIPMFGKKNSINVANAVSVICFQIANALSA